MTINEPPDGRTSNPLDQEFAGWGEIETIEDLEPSGSVDKLDQDKKHFLSEWPATAICGNDITSSCLYVSALSITVAGVYAPVALLLVSMTLYLFRKIYSEVGSALPLNGGTYTLLLNTTSKKVAAGAACLTILSYIATAVISAHEAIHYLAAVIPGINISLGTMLLLFAFAALTVLGVSESARVALGIFSTHIITLALLVLVGVFSFFWNFSGTVENLTHSVPQDHWYVALGKGYLVALLGISGFESSANYIEEQQPGVFDKTLRNMWISITAINPTICILALGILPLSAINSDKANLLARLGADSLHPWFGSWIGINAFLVLSGAVLTSFVGVTGLDRRMALDRCLPQFLLAENQSRGTNHWIIFGFFLVCVSIFVITGGEIDSLAGVYTISFLAVMLLFAAGNALLKVTRGKLPRSSRAHWGAVITAATLVTIGLVGNVFISPEGAQIFSAYYAVTFGIVLFFLLRTALLRFLLNSIRYSVGLLPGTKEVLGANILKWIDRINSREVVYFSKGDNLSTLNRAAQYVLRNEQCKRLKIVHVYPQEGSIPPSLWYQARVIDEIYPHLRVDLVLVKGQFSPKLVDALSKRLEVAKNQMFIGTPGDAFPHRIEALGGVRVVI
ncbi:MAG: APC family permease [Bdellovibrionales bacterium]